MNKKQQIGHDGEQMAYRYLVEQGYAILECNWRMGKNEVDIIAYDATSIEQTSKIVFVEVKTRSGSEFGSPESAVDLNKQRAYIRLANAYVIQHNRTEEVRFDIIAIEPVDGVLQLTHYRDAFNAISVI